ncbi:hypothetical protein K3495_g3125 [Podosphaera aphanis]|nr:hypothetical protein K3495_g3125 [Podosphaera aphanis]
MEYPTIAAKLQATYLTSYPFHSKSFEELSPGEKSAYALSQFLKLETWRSWDVAQQKAFWKSVEEVKVPIPLPKPQNLGKDRRGREIGNFSPKEFSDFERREWEMGVLREKSRRFKELAVRDESEIIAEVNRRKLLGAFDGKKMGRYEGDPAWDDVVPIPQEDGEGALAAIAYTDEYVEVTSYLRAIMAVKEHSPRALALTAHVIALNPAHYTVWLYRASIIFALNTSISAELEWLNEVALQNQKNYQIWHHRQLLIDHLYPSIATDSESMEQLAASESSFIQTMFDADSKNYHVWSYRQYLVRKLNLFNATEMASIETLLSTDIRNNSAWSHRFFLVFSNPEYVKVPVSALNHDPQIPDDIIEREKVFAKTAIAKAPQNQCPWSYLRGVLRKEGRSITSEEKWAAQYFILGAKGSAEAELVKSSHALDFLADVWAEQGEYEKADEALRLLGEKYDRIRKNYWEWKRDNLRNGR